MEAYMDYSRRYMRWNANKAESPLGEHPRPLKIYDQGSPEATDALALERAHGYILQYELDHPDERLTLEDVYRCEVEKDPVLIYSSR